VPRRIRVVRPLPILVPQLRAILVAPRPRTREEPPPDILAASEPPVITSDRPVAILAAERSPAGAGWLDTTARADPNLAASLTKCAADMILPDVLMADRVTFVWPMA